MERGGWNVASRMPGDDLPSGSPRSPQVRFRSDRTSFVVAKLAIGADRPSQRPDSGKVVGAGVPEQVGCSQRRPGSDWRLQGSHATRARGIEKARENQVQLEFQTFTSLDRDQKSGVPSFTEAHRDSGMEIRRPMVPCSHFAWAEGAKTNTAANKRKVPRRSANVDRYCNIGRSR